MTKLEDREARSRNGFAFVLGVSAPFKLFCHPRDRNFFRPLSRIANPPTTNAPNATSPKKIFSATITMQQPATSLHPNEPRSYRIDGPEYA